MTVPSFAEKLTKAGPRKLLALDGGGIRGIIAVEILAQIEKELRSASLSSRSATTGSTLSG
ncbi:hypothetical protein BH18VER2_BH18VER2_16450 [soil metagenome]